MVGLIEYTPLFHPDAIFDVNSGFFHFILARYNGE